MNPVVKPSSIEITNALNTLQNLCLFHEVGNHMLELLQKFESLHVHDTARQQSSILTFLTENKIPITVKISIYFVKISIYFLSPIAIKTYQSQYRSKYSIRFTQCFTEGKDFEFSAISNFFAGPVRAPDSGCPL